MATRRTPQMVSEANSMYVASTFYWKSVYSMCLAMASREGIIYFLILKRAPSMKESKLDCRNTMHSFLPK